MWGVDLPPIVGGLDAPEPSIATALLKTEPRHVASFENVGWKNVEKSGDEKNKTSAKYNGLCYRYSGRP